MGFMDNRKKKYTGYNSDDSGSKSYGNRPFRDSGKTLSKATCASCGNSCQVPFKPNGEKPVYCNDCFRKNDSNSFDRPSPRYNKGGDSDRRDFRSDNRGSGSGSTLDQINVKLDRILKLLGE